MKVTIALVLGCMGAATSPASMAWTAPRFEQDIPIDLDPRDEATLRAAIEKAYAAHFAKLPSRDREAAAAHVAAQVSAFAQVHGAERAREVLKELPHKISVAAGRISGAHFGCEGRAQDRPPPDPTRARRHDEDLLALARTANEEVIVHLEGALIPPIPAAQREIALTQLRSLHAEMVVKIRLLLQSPRHLALAETQVGRLLTANEQNVAGSPWESFMHRPLTAAEYGSVREWITGLAEPIPLSDCPHSDNPKEAVQFFRSSAMGKAIDRLVYADLYGRLRRATAPAGYAERFFASMRKTIEAERRHESLVDPPEHEHSSAPPTTEDSATPQSSAARLPPRGSGQPHDRSATASADSDAVQGEKSAGCATVWPVLPIAVILWLVWTWRKGTAVPR